MARNEETAEFEDANGNGGSHGNIRLRLGVGDPSKVSEISSSHRI